MGELTEYDYDVFISYSHVDKEWVHGWLLPELERAKLRVCIDSRDFAVGVPSLVNMERAVDRSRHTLLVLTPAWVESQWTTFESLLIQTADPAGRRQRLIPLRLKPCEPPGRIAMLTYADFCDYSAHASQLGRVIEAVNGKRHMPEPISGPLAFEPETASVPAGPFLMGIPSGDAAEDESGPSMRSGCQPIASGSVR